MIQGYHGFDRFFCPDNNSDKTLTPINSPMAKPEEPKLNVTDSIGINLLGSVDKKDGKCYSTKCSYTR